MKKILSCFFAAALLVAMAGCSTDSKSSEDTLVVGTFNIDAKSQPDVEAQRDLMAENGVEIMGLQEVDNQTIRNPYDVVEKFAKDPYVDEYYTNCIGFQGGEYGIAIISQYELQDESETKLFSDLFKGEELKEAYANNDPDDPASEEALNAVSEKGPVEPRYYQRVVFEKNGKKIAFYNTRLSYEDMELRAQQMQTLKEALDNDSCEYKIIVGDFNATQSTREFDLFKDEYSISNGKDGKWLDTFNGTDDTMNVNSVDNVIVSKNITINKVQMLDSKLSDHNPMVVELTLN